MTKFEETLKGFDFEDDGYKAAKQLAKQLAKTARKVLRRRYLGELYAAAADGSELDFNRYGESIKLRHHWGCVKVYVNDRLVYNQED